MATKLSVLLQEDHGPDRRRPDRGNESREQRRAAKHSDGTQISADVPRADPIEKPREQSRHGERTGKPQCQADRHHPESLTNDKADDFASAGTQGAADRQLPCSLSHQVPAHGLS